MTKPKISIQERKLALEADLTEEHSAIYIVQCASSKDHPKWASISWWALPDTIKKYVTSSLSHDSPQFYSRQIAYKVMEMINKSGKRRARVILRVTAIKDILQ